MNVSETVVLNGRTWCCARLRSDGKAERKAGDEEVVPADQTSVAGRSGHISYRSHLSAAAIQNPVAKEIKHDIKMVPRRPKSLLRGAFVQQPSSAEQR